MDYKTDQNSSMLLMIALRASDMDEVRWQRLKDTHAVEVGLIKSLIETGYDHRRQPYD